MAVLINEPAEQAVLGAVLCNPPAIGQLAPLVNADDFGIDMHRRLWTIMHTLFVNGRPPDVLHVVDSMNRDGIQYFGDAPEAYLAELILNTPVVAYANHYAEAVAEMAERRRFAHAVRTSVSMLEAGGDVDALIDETNTHLKTVARPRSRGRYRHVGDVDDDVFGEAIPRAFFGGHFWEIDGIVGGIESGQMIVFGARTSVGKTASMMQALWSMASTHNAPVGVVSLEMSARSLRKRLLGHIALVDIADKERTKRSYTDAEWERLNDARDQLATTPLFIDEDVQRNIGSVTERIRSLVIEQRCAVVGVDYLQLLADNGKGENRAQEMARISGAMKQLAMELGIPIIALAQLNRGVDARDRGEPLLSDFKDSGAIEQDADVAILLHPDVAFKKRHLGLDDTAINASDRQFVRFTIAKNRNGATGSCVLEYRRRYTEFVPVTDAQVGKGR
jgi:replicative DNA helicase